MSPTSYRTAPPRAKVNSNYHAPNELAEIRQPDEIFQIKNRKSQIGNALVGLGRVELPTSRLSGVRSNQLSYRPLGSLPRQMSDELVRRKFRPACRSLRPLNAKKSHTSLLRSVAYGGHAGGPCSFGGYLLPAIYALARF